jgi:hypothetical protein
MEQNKYSEKQEIINAIRRKRSELTAKMAGINAELEYLRELEEDINGDILMGWARTVRDD